MNLLCWKVRWLGWVSVLNSSSVLVIWWLCWLSCCCGGVKCLFCISLMVCFRLKWLSVWEFF